jgi:hypothetical protein
MFTFKVLGRAKTCLVGWLEYKIVNVLLNVMSLT